MRVVFDSITVLDVFVGQSKEGKTFGKVRFLTDTYELFDIFVGAQMTEKLKALTPHTVSQNVPFDLVAGNNGGVRLLPAW